MQPATQPVVIALGFRAPLEPSNLFGHLAATAVPGVEEWRDGAYRRTLALRGGPGIVALRPGPEHVRAELALADPDDRAEAVARCRRLLDLDADPARVDAALAEDPVLAPLVRRAPGRRVPGTADGAELALRAVLGQQVSTAAARTHAGRLVAAVGTPVADPGGGLTHLFPAPGRVVDAPPSLLALPRGRAAALRELAAALASGEVDVGPGADPDAARSRLREIQGVGPWTIETVAMRALRDPDAFLPGDLGVRQAAQRLGLPTDPAALARRAEPWRPWRAYAVQHLWATGAHPVNRLPSA
jgi:AraC family transcriptional regulator, regulatory protein of adaptative response / DNA-3-methyladenine glycosylase II